MSSSKTIQDYLRFEPLYTMEKELAVAALSYKNPHNDIVDPDTYVGIEVEVEGVLTGSQIHVARRADGTSDPLWKNVEDGSLRNNGREFVSLPIRGNNIPFALDSLRSFLTKNSNCKGHEFSPRTSVHVHMDVRSLTPEQVQSILLTYLVVEPVLYNFCGGRRHKNIFCVPLNQTNLEGFIHSVFTASGSRVIDFCHSWKKYTGFNLKPVRTQGTVEFRHMVGTIDVERLITWINLLLKLRMYATKHSFADIKNTVVQLNTTSEYAMLLHQIFGEYADHVMMDNLQDKLEEMVIFVKDCFSKAQFSEQLMKECSHDFTKTKFFQAALENSFIIKRGGTSSSKKRDKTVEVRLRERAEEMERILDINIPNVPETWAANVARTGARFITWDDLAPQAPEPEEDF